MRFALVIALLSVQLLMAGDDAFSNEFESEFSNKTAKEEFDPLRGYNRFMTGFNDMFYTNVVFPVARGYEYIIPENGRLAVSRFYHNLKFPVRFVNNLLQLKFRNSAEELSRFVINSTAGLGGFFDPAQNWLELKPHNEDFGQTLGFYGVGGGFHIVLPFFGPSNLRDTLGLASDWYLDPSVYWDGRRWNLLDTYGQGLAATSLRILNESSFNYAAYESMKKDAVDLYPFFKNIYEQSREKAIQE